MSGLEVIGAISAVIGIIDATVKVWDGARKDLNFSKTFQVVANRLPILKDTLAACSQYFESIERSLPADAADSLLKILGACEERMKKLNTIFEETMVKADEQWYEKYRHVAKRWGKTTKVEELAKVVAEDVQSLVNYHLVKIATAPQLNAELAEIITEMETADPSLPDDEAASQIFNAYGGQQKVSTGNSRMYNSENSGSGTTHNYGGITGGATFNVK